jgi:hypothetical protein
MRNPKPNRAQRRGQAIDTIIRRRAAAAFNDWADKDLADIERGIERLASRARTLKFDEGRKAVSHGSAASLVADSAIWNEHTTIEELPSTHIIPRQALTEKLFLRMFKPVMTFRDVPFRVLDERSKAILASIAAQVATAHPANREKFRDFLMSRVTLEYISGTTPKLDWKSDETLLVARKPDMLATVKVTRQTANNRTFEQESDELPEWDETTPRTWDDENPLAEPDRPTGKS